MRIEDLREFRGGPLSIWRMPEPRMTYIAGIDSGEGLGQEDSVCDIFCRNTGIQCAQYITNTEDPEEFALNSIKLLEWYNYAKVVPETNNTSGGILLITLRNEYKKGKIYLKKVFDKKKKAKRNEYGWKTTTGNRGTLIFDFKRGIKNGFIEIKSVRTLAQTKTFVRKDSGKMEHADNEKDDTIFGGGLAWQGFKDIMPKKYEKEEKKKEKRTTMGEYMKLMDGRTEQKGDFIIGSDNHRDEFTIVV